jgi:hypothetical protein
MRVAFRHAGASAACLVLAVSTLSSAELSRYREFTLGSSLPSVTAVTKTTERDLKTIHSRPAMLQQLEWRPRYMTGAPVPGRDSIDRVVFDFVDNQLFKMSIAYARDRTNGLTDADMVDSLVAVYGAPSSPSRHAVSPGFDSSEGIEVIAEWRQADATVALRHGPYSEAFTLVITSLSLDTIARKAQATAVIMDEREAPAREAAQEKKRADDARRAEELARSTNKKVFQP